jgi:phage protein D/phage baseplate assembly protein gpV
MTTNNKPRAQSIVIKVEGSPLNRDMMDDLFEAEVETTLYLPSMFTLRFHDDANFRWLDSSHFQVGGSVEIELGDPVSYQMVSLMKGEITAIEPEFGEDHQTVLVVRGYDRRHRLNRGTKSRAFIQMTDADIVGKIAQEAGLQVTADATNQVHEHVFQHSLSDLAFLHQRAQRIGFEVFVDDRKLFFRKAKAGTPIELKWGVQMLSFRPRMTVSKQVNEVTVKGWDPKTKKEIIGVAGSSTSEPALSPRKSGGQVARSAFSDAKQVEVRRPVRTQDEAKNIAQAILDEINAGYVLAEGVAFGDPKLVAGAKVSLENVGQRFGGTYVLTSTQHVYGHGEYRTYFTVEGRRPQQMVDLVGEVGAEPAGTQWGGVVIGLVSNNNDPQKLGRVKVKFPWLDDQLESNWARVCAVGAGNARGLHWLPEVNDEVVVAFEHGDFNYPYVLGNVWNGKDKQPEESAVSGGKVEIRTLKTREGHLIRLTDGPQKSIEIIDSDTNTSIKMDTQSKKVTIVSKGDISLEATAGSIELKGRSIKIEATADVTVSGQTGKVEATATLDVKGGMVNIN